jgi:hypothetical protein
MAGITYPKGVSMKVYRMLVLVVLAALVPIGLSAQHRGLRKAMAQANAAADSANFHVELGMDLRALKTGDSLPAEVRLGVIVDPTFSIEAGVAAQQDSDYIEADVALGATAAVFPGATTQHGQYVFGSALLHYEGGAFQPGVRFGTGDRQVGSASAGMIVRVSTGVQHLFKRGSLAASNSAYVAVGISLLK